MSVYGKLIYLQYSVGTPLSRIYSLFSLSVLFEKTIMVQAAADERAQTIGDGVVRGSAALIIALAIGSLHPLPSSVFGYFILVVLVDVLATVFYYKSLLTIQASMSGIVMSTMFMWVTLMSIVFLHEHLTLLKVSGIVVVFTGTLIALYKNQKLSLSRGLIYAFLAPFLWGISLTFSYYILRVYNAPSLEAYENLAVTVVVLIAQPMVVKKLKFYLNPKNALFLGIIGTLTAIASISNFYAYQFGHNATILAPLGSTRILFILLLSAVFLKERDNLKRKFLGAIVALLGVVLLLA